MSFSHIHTVLVDEFRSVTCNCRVPECFMLTVNQIMTLTSTVCYSVSAQDVPEGLSPYPTPHRRRSTEGGVCLFFIIVFHSVKPTIPYFICQVICGPEMLYCTISLKSSGKSVIVMLKRTLLHQLDSILFS